MDRLDRIFALHQILRDARHPVSSERLQRDLECSSATLRRLVQQMRLHFDAPIESSRRNGGYWYAERERQTFELPGLWFSPGELHALVASLELLRQQQSGLLETHLDPLRARIERLLSRGPFGNEQALNRIRVLNLAARHLDTATFRTVASAVLSRRRLIFDYTGRGRGNRTHRTVSPQRLTHYRDNWYLDAWCHARNALRIFSLERIERAVLLRDTADDIDDADLDAHYADAYGIFAGPARHTAVLRFTAQRARWIANEQWHPRQQGRWLDDGRYELRLPYGDPRELTLDIMRYGPDVEVVAPSSLRQEVADRLEYAAAQYRSSD